MRSQMQRLQKLLFELSSEERMGILLELKGKGSRLSEIARSRKMNVSEASRHLQRLIETGLLDRDADGAYRLSAYGSLVLTELAGLEEVTKHADFFRTHDLGRIPPEFVSRFGEVSEGEPDLDTFRNINQVEELINGAQKYVWVMADQVLRSSAPALVEKHRKGVEIRIIMPASVMPKDSASMLPSTMPGVQKRVLRDVDIVIGATDKLAGFCLPNREGRFDYAVFKGRDPRIIKWCADVFQYYWNKAIPIDK